MSTREKKGALPPGRGGFDILGRVIRYPERGGEGVGIPRVVLLRKCRTSKSKVTS